jgi:hypothetical protein
LELSSGEKSDGRSFRRVSVGVDVVEPSLPFELDALNLGNEVESARAHGARPHDGGMRSLRSANIDERGRSLLTRKSTLYASNMPGLDFDFRNGTWKDHVIYSSRVERHNRAMRC